MKNKSIKRLLALVLCIVFIANMAVCALAVSTEEIHNPVYDKDTENSVWSYVYFGHYPQSEITGDDLTKDIINANYNKYGVAIVDKNQIFRVDTDDSKYEVNYEYFLVEPIKWQVLNIDDNYMTLLSDCVLRNGIYYNYGKYANWKISKLRSWLNGYDYSYNINSQSFEEPFENFVSVAFFEDEQDICQLIDITTEDTTTSDYIVLPTIKTVTNTKYGFTSSDWYSKTRQKNATDYSVQIVDSATDYKKYFDGDSWYLIDGFVSGSDTYNSDHVGDVNNSYSEVGYGVVPMVRILKDSDQYYTSKPDLVMGKDISTAKVNLKYNSVDYSGQAKEPKVTVKDGNTTLTENVDYTVKYTDNINAGTAKVIISGCGNYYGNIEKTFTINRLEQEITRVESSYEKTYGDEAFRLNAITSGNGTISYSSSDESVVIAAPKTGKITIMGTGRATVTVLADETTNYNQATKEIDIVVYPGQITGLKQKSVNASNINLSWNKCGGAEGYEIYRYNDIYEEYRLISVVKSGSASSYTDKSVSAGKSYKYKVRAYVNGNEKNYFGKYSSVLSACTKTKNTQITKVTYKKNKVTVKCNKISCSGYQFKIANNSKFKSAKTINGVTATYSGTYKSSTKKVFVKVRPYIKCNGKTYYGAWSKVKSAKSK